MSDQPKVLMVLNDLAWFWTHRLPLARGILDRGWNLTVAADGAQADQKLKEMGVDGVEIYNPGKGFNPIKEFKIFISVLKVIKETKPDLIHALTLRYAFYTALAARLSGHKAGIFTLAGLGTTFAAPDLKSRLIRFFLTPLLGFAFRHKNAFIIFQNPDDYNTLRKAHVVSSKRSVVIKSSGVDLNAFQYTPPPEGEQVVLFSSRLIREKGLEDFVKAAQMLKNKGINARFDVAGDIYEKNPKTHKRSEVRKWHDEGAINWLGQVDDMPRQMKRCAIFVLPSYYREGVPKVVLEALATGRPVITTAMPGCKETVEDGVNGFLVLPRDPVMLADKIETLLRDEERRKAMGKASRAKAEREFGTELVVSDTLRIYDRALKGQE